MPVVVGAGYPELVEDVTDGIPELGEEYGCPVIEVRMAEVVVAPMTRVELEVEPGPTETVVVATKVVLFDTGVVVSRIRVELVDIELVSEGSILRVEPALDMGLFVVLLD